VKIQHIKAGSKDFPARLINIPDSPKDLYVIGDLTSILVKTSLSVVGSRRVSPYGRGVTTNLVSAVASRGVSIVSGLAIGVDGISHEVALSSGGRTVAVLPCGLDAPYPVRHRQLARRILEKGGALISEYPSGTPPLQHHFIARNRIVAGLGDGLLVTEAAAKSGTMHTAGFALDQGKPVMTVPGNITSYLSQGTNNLIKSGAIPVTEVSDITQALKLDVALEQSEVLAASKEEEAILSQLKLGVSDAEQLQILSELNPETFNQTLTMLEITGKITPIGAGNWSIAG